MSDYATLLLKYMKNLMNQGHAGQPRRKQSEQCTLSPTELANMRLEPPSSQESNLGNFLTTFYDSQIFPEVPVSILHWTAFEDVQF